MPNHIHILWEMREMNGKEMPYASLQKHTANAFNTELKQNHHQVLQHFKVAELERTFRFWQRDPLAIHISSREMAEHKLDYMHFNPL
jgi:REP element-mobilizing transposase RayT